MSQRRTQVIRTVFRVLWLAAEIGRALVVYVPTVSWRNNRRAAQARWLQRACQRGLRVLGVSVACNGPLPRRGLLVSNHLSYVDILVLGALAPCTFLSKSEVKSWPIFGWFAQLSGTLFIRRHRKSDIPLLNQQIADALAHSALVVLFPEGTTSDGQNVLPFKSALLEPITTTAHALHAARLDYVLSDGDVGQEVCYWGEMTLLPHLINLMAKQRIRASVRYFGITDRSVDRKQLAHQLRARIAGNGIARDESTERTALRTEGFLPSAEKGDPPCTPAVPRSGRAGSPPSLGSRHS